MQAGRKPLPKNLCSYIMVMLPNLNFPLAILTLIAALASLGLQAVVKVQGNCLNQGLNHDKGNK